jgi:hypothetical protein
VIYCDYSAIAQKVQHIMREPPLHKLSPYTTKLALSKVMNCSVRSIHHYHQLAVLYIDDFINDYPLIGNQRHTKAPLTPYQCWIIWQLHDLLAVRLPAELIKQQLETSPQTQANFSKSAFNNLYPDLNTNESERICNPKQLLTAKN